MPAVLIDDIIDSGLDLAKLKDIIPDININWTNADRQVMIQKYAQAYSYLVVVKGVLSQQSITGLVAPGADLSEVNLSGMNANGCNLDGANLHGGNFTGSSFSGGSFVGADLTNAGFRDANLSGCTFTGATTLGADFTGANLTNVVGLVLTGAIR